MGALTLASDLTFSGSKRTQSKCFFKRRLGQRKL